MKFNGMAFFPGLYDRPGKGTSGLSYAGADGEDQPRRLLLSLPPRVDIQSFHMASDPLLGTGLLQSPNYEPERREHTRHPVNLRVMVAIGKTILHGRAENLSSGGAGLRLEEPLAEGTAVTVRFLTPHLEKFQCIDVGAAALYTTLTSGSPPYRVGIRFVGVNVEARRRIGALIGE